MTTSVFAFHINYKFSVKVCTISFERPVNYLCDAWHVFPPKYEAWTHFNRPWTEYQCQGVVWTLLIIFTESVNRSTCPSVYLIITRLRNVNLLYTTSLASFLSQGLHALKLPSMFVYFASWHAHCEFFLSRPFPGSLSVIWNN